MASLKKGNKLSCLHGIPGMEVTEIMNTRRYSFMCIQCNSIMLFFKNLENLSVIAKLFIVTYTYLGFKHLVLFWNK